MKKLGLSKKILCGILTVTMVLSSLVFCASTQTAFAATAGKYYVRVTYTVTGENNLKGAYGGFNKEVNDAAGISVGYKNTNGTDSTVNYKDWDIKSCSGGTNKLVKGTYTLTGELTGFPTILYCYLDDDYFLSGICYQVQKLEVSANSNMSSATTLWSGTMQVKSKTNPYAASVSFDGTNKVDYFHSDGDTYVSGSSGAWEMPKANSVTGAKYAKTSVTAPKPGATNVTNTVNTTGVVTKDQYGVVIGNPTYSVTQTASTGVTTSGTTTTVTSSANQAGTVDSKTVTSTFKSAFNGGTASQSSKISFTVNDCTLSYKFVDYDDSELSSNSLSYGHTPSAPSDPIRDFNATAHYAFKGWDRTITQLTSDSTTYKAQYTETPHNQVISEVNPTDKAEGHEYFMCDGCDAKWTIGDRGGVGTFVHDMSETEFASLTNVPAPDFNSFVSAEDKNYDYSKRGAALKVPSADADHQQIRFTASMKIPEGASVNQFGYVYSQARFADSTDALVKDGENVYSYICQNYTNHDGTYTFNLVINAKHTNWAEARAYVARAYVNYTYKGKTYTVYDSGYSKRSVEAVARAAVADASASAYLKDYCQTHIISRL